MKFLRALISTTILSIFLASGAFAEKRIALVIGNATYINSPTLKNPKNDADDIAAALKRLSFDVSERLDLKLVQFDQDLEKFFSTAKDADIALLFYSGHGLQIERKGYLVPTNFKPESWTSAFRQLVAIQEIISKLEKAAKVTVIILDACRDGPIQERLLRFALEQNRSTLTAKGLPPVSIYGTNTLVVYATTPGNTASDGTGRNSPFTSSCSSTLKHAGSKSKLCSSALHATY